MTRCGMSRIEHTAMVLTRAGELHRQALREHGIDVACRRGCHWCCYEPVDTHEAEAELLADAVTKLGRGRVRRRLVKLAKRIDRCGVAFDDYQGYRDLRALCPLCEDGECLVYDVRPLSCRIHVMEHDSGFCRPERTEHGRVPRIPEILVGALLALGHGAIMRLPGALAQALGDDVPVQREEIFLSAGQVYAAADKGNQQARTILGVLHAVENMA